MLRLCVFRDSTWWGQDKGGWLLLRPPHTSHSRFQSGSVTGHCHPASDSSSPPKPRTTATRSQAPRTAPPFPLQYKLSSGASVAGLELGRREQCWGGGSPEQTVGWDSGRGQAEQCWGGEGAPGRRWGASLWERSYLIFWPLSSSTAPLRIMFAVGLS